MSINKYSLCVVGIKRRNEFCVPPCFILPHESWDKQHRIVHGQKAMHCLWSTNVCLQPYILLSVIPLLKWCPKSEESPETWGFAIITPSLAKGVNKPLQEANKHWSSPLLVAWSCCWEESFPLALQRSVPLKQEENFTYIHFCTSLLVTCYSENAKKKKKHLKNSKIITVNLTSSPHPVFYIQLSIA